MFEKEAEEYYYKTYPVTLNIGEEERKKEVTDIFIKSAEFGYNKAKEEAKHDLMIKLKDEGIVKPLKDSILRNERLSSQEQQELCVWIECAIDFGENLDECAKELEEAKKANEWHYVKDELPPIKKEYCGRSELVLVLSKEKEMQYAQYVEREKTWARGICEINFKPYAWKEIVLPKENE